MTADSFLDPGGTHAPQEDLVQGWLHQLEPAQRCSRREHALQQLLGVRPRGKLDLDPVTVRKARSLARQVGRPIVKLAQQHTTVSVERATLRLAGLQGADADGIPWVNRLLDAVRAL